MDDTSPNRRSGLIDIDGRLDVVVDPGAEWAQMLGETWRRLRDEWWHPGEFIFFIFSYGKLD